MTPRRLRRGIVTRLVEQVVSTSRIYARAPGPAVDQAVAPYVVRPATLQDLERLERDLSGELAASKAELIRRRSADPDMDVIVAALPDGRICAYGHSHYGWIRDDHLRLDLGPVGSVVHLFDDYVAQQHRGHRLQAAILAARLRAAKARGAAVATILVADSNHASRRSVAIAGFTPAVRVLTLRSWGVRRSWAVGARPTERLVTADGSSSAGLR